MAETPQALYAAAKQHHEQTRQEVKAHLMKAKPTPGQAEMDQVKMGIAVTLAPDGSGPDPFAVPIGRSMRPAVAGAGYTTRAATPRTTT